ncbi:MAG: hypothetical protein IKQ41_07155 [Clostridia bacterium]|nr:hypothetical protein [Clostridia bacterium]
MKKACIVLLCLGLMASSVLLISWSGEKDALRREAARAKDKNAALQTQFSQEQAEWDQASAALKDQAQKLRQENADLTARLSDANEKWLAARQQAEALSTREQQAIDALKKAKQQWNAQLQTLAEQNEALSGKLENALTALLPIEETKADLFAFAKEEAGLPVPPERVTEGEMRPRE